MRTPFLNDVDEALLVPDIVGEAVHEAYPLQPLEVLLDELGHFALDPGPL